MFTNMTIRKRFTTIIVILFLASLPLALGGSFWFLKKNADQEVFKQANLLVSTMEATRHYVIKYTTPILEREIPGKFVVQGMADSFVNNVIFKQIEKDHPNYSYKEAAVNPLNLNNKADIFEEKKLNEFKAGSLKDEWRGFMDKPTGKFYTVMKPIRVIDESCLSCHGDPDLAPDAVTNAYGKEHGYHWEVGDVVAVDAIYVPAAVPLEKALVSLTIFAGAYFAFVILVIIIINISLSRSVLKPISDMAAAADKISMGDFRHTFQAGNNDEMKRLADSFGRMRTSLIKLVKMMEKKGGRES